LFDPETLNLAEVVLAACCSRDWQVATAESCTGGLVAAALTAIAGSSDVFKRGFVTYSNEAKRELLGVPAEVIAGYGGVSPETAAAMARGAVARAGVDLAVAVTGIAGPGGGTPQKPVGTVVIAVLAPGHDAYVRTYQFIGVRTQVKFQSTQAALDRVRRMLAQ